MLHPVILLFLALLLVLGVIVLLRTLTFTRHEGAPLPYEPEPVDGQVVAQRLAAAIHCKTISDADSSRVDVREFQSIHQLIGRTYPLVHRRLETQVVGERSLIFTWKGSQPGLAPILFAGHMDVVPVDAHSLDKWHYPPFDGTVADGFVWGRGSQDNKNQVIALLECVEMLLQKGYQPRRTIYLAFGGDEEVGGTRGAKEIVQFLKKQGVELAAALDEGGSVLGSGLPGVKAQLAMVGVAAVAVAPYVWVTTVGAMGRESLVQLALPDEAHFLGLAVGLLPLWVALGIVGRPRLGSISQAIVGLVAIAFALVFLLARVVDEVEVKIDPNDLRIDVYRSSGPGGQHMQKNATAVRITHLPTGMVVACESERSQLQNRQRAMSVLRARLYEMEEQKQHEELDERRRSQVGTGERAEKIRTYNFPQSRVTDHRIGLTSYRLEGILDGDLDEFIEELATTEQAEKLRRAGLS